MELGKAFVKSFEPDIFIKVAKMEDGSPVLGLLKEVYKSLGKKYNTLVDTKKGIIYLRKKSIARNFKDKLEEGDKEIEGYSKLKDHKEGASDV